MTGVQTCALPIYRQPVVEPFVDLDDDVDLLARTSHAELDRVASRDNVGVLPCSGPGRLCDLLDQALEVDWREVALHFGGGPGLVAHLGKLERVVEDLGVADSQLGSKNSSLTEIHLSQTRNAHIGRVEQRLCKEVAVSFCDAYRWQEGRTEFDKRRGTRHFADELDLRSNRVERGPELQAVESSADALRIAGSPTQQTSWEI